jgi:hypothetical protein
MFIPDLNFSIPVPKFFQPGSRIRIKEFKHFNQKKLFLTFRKYEPGCSSRIRILVFLPIPDPRVKKAPDPGSGTATLPPPTKYRTKDAELLGLPC